MNRKRISSPIALGKWVYYVISAIVVMEVFRPILQFPFFIYSALECIILIFIYLLFDRNRKMQTKIEFDETHFYIITQWEEEKILLQDMRELKLIKGGIDVTSEWEITYLDQENQELKSVRFMGRSLDSDFRSFFMRVQQGNPLLKIVVGTMRAIEGK